MQLISYAPIECINDPSNQCKELAAYVRLDIKGSQKQKALL
jgi:class 3 adenylate cyclase